MDEENIGGDASEAHDEIQDTISILSDLSEEEEVPNSGQHTLNIFLQKAMNNMEESIKRGSNGFDKASYAVKIGQKQARRTENHHTQQKRKALEEGRQGGNLITNWFQLKGGPHTIHVQEDQVTYDQDPDITEMPASFPASSTHPPSPKQPSNPPPKNLSNPQTTPLSAGGIPPTLDEARSALDVIKNILRPPRDTGGGYKHAKLDLLLRGQLKLMKMLLIKYEDILSRPGMPQLDVWGATAIEVTKMAARGGWLARQLKKWTRTLIADHEVLPQNIYGRTKIWCKKSIYT